MALDNWRYARNATDTDQVLLSQILPKLGGWVSVLPVGLVEMVTPRLVLKPGWIVKIPYPVWSEAVYRNSRLDTVSKEQVDRILETMAKGKAFEAACRKVFSITDEPEIEPEPEVMEDEPEAVPKVTARKRRT